jgi:hypothetical protein
MNLGWMKFTDGEPIRIMPNIPDRENNQTMYRVNYCPSCGTYIRDIELAI